MRILATLGRDSAPVFPVSTILRIVIQNLKSSHSHRLLSFHCKLDQAADCSVYVCVLPFKWSLTSSHTRTTPRLTPCELSLTGFLLTELMVWSSYEHGHRGDDGSGPAFPADHCRHEGTVINYSQHSMLVADVIIFASVLIYSCDLSTATLCEKLRHYVSLAARGWLAKFSDTKCISQSSPNYWPASIGGKQIWLISVTFLLDNSNQ